MARSDSSVLRRPLAAIRSDRSDSVLERSDVWSKMTDVAAENPRSYVGLTDLQNHSYQRMPTLILAGRAAPCTNHITIDRLAYTSAVVKGPWVSIQK